MAEQTGTVSRPLFSKVLYPRFAAAAKAHGDPEHRRQLLAGLTGRVIEVGVGDGANFDHYPDSVTHVLAVEPENHLREQATGKARSARVQIEVAPGLADELPAQDGSLDVGVCSLVLCSVPDQARALAELRRVLRPGGELRFYEHVRAHKPGLSAAQNLVTPIWCRLGGGCHLNRDTEQAITDAGFEIEAIEHIWFAPGRLEALGGDHILGVARSA